MFAASWLNEYMLTLMQCYEFAVKSYATGWDDIYKLESEAFRAVRSHEGVVKYLGEYHFRECGAASPTHNILLEYGQQDLDEYIADTYPPVLNNEIIAFWEDLFKVAATLKRLHQFQYKSEDGRTKHYKGLVTVRKSQGSLTLIV